MTVPSPPNPYDLAPTAPAGVDLSAGVVTSDAPCRRCGYNLRGLPKNGQCPECGASVARSLRGNVLELADPAYLHRLRRGAILVESSIITLVALPLAAFTVAIFSSALPPLGGDLASAVLGISAFLALAASVLILLGWFMLTERDPGHLGADVSDRARGVTRISTIVCAAAWVVVAGTIASSAFGAAAAMGPPLLIGGAMLFLAISVCVQIVASLRYIAYLAQRVPDTRLEAELASTRALAIVMSLCILSPALGILGTFFACISMVGVFAGLILALVFAVRYTDAMDRIRRHITAAATGTRV